MLEGWQNKMNIPKVSGNRVTPNANPNVVDRTNATPDLFTNQAVMGAAQVLKVGATVGATALKAKNEIAQRRDKQNRSEARAIVNNLNKASDQYVVDESIKKGNETFGATERATEWQKKTFEEYTQNVNPKVRDYVQAGIAPKFTSSSLTIARQQAQQLEAYERATVKDEIDTAGTAMIANPSPENIGVFLKDSDSNIAFLNRGMSDVTIDRARMDIQTPYLKSAIDSLGQSDPEGAKELFKQNKERIDPREYPAIEAINKANRSNYKARAMAIRAKAIEENPKLMTELIGELDEHIAQQEKGKEGVYRKNPQESSNKFFDKEQYEDISTPDLVKFKMACEEQVAELKIKAYDMLIDGEVPTPLENEKLYLNGTFDKKLYKHVKAINLGKAIKKDAPAVSDLLFDIAHGKVPTTKTGRLTKVEKLKSKLATLDMETKQRKRIDSLIDSRWIQKEIKTKRNPNLIYLSPLQRMTSFIKDHNIDPKYTSELEELYNELILQQPEDKQSDPDVQDKIINSFFALEDYPVPSALNRVGRSGFFGNHPEYRKRVKYRFMSMLDDNQREIAKMSLPKKLIPYGEKGLVKYDPELKQYEVKIPGGTMSTDLFGNPIKGEIPNPERKWKDVSNIKGVPLVTR